MALICIVCAKLHIFIKSSFLYILTSYQTHPRLVELRAQEPSKKTALPL